MQVAKDDQTVKNGRESFLFPLIDVQSARQLQSAIKGNNDDNTPSIPTELLDAAAKSLGVAEFKKLKVLRTWKELVDCAILLLRT
jgi:hypothetical protein